MKEEMDGGVFISHFSSIDNVIKVILPLSTLNWRVNNYVSRQGKGVNKGNESVLVII